MLKTIEANNTLEFLKYAEIYPSGEIKRYLHLLHEGFIYVLGLETDEKPIAFIVVERRNGLHHVCSSFFLHHEAKNWEFKRLLLERALEASKAEGAEHFYISYFKDSKESERAKKLYESFGFKPSGYMRHTFVIDRQEIGMAIQHMSSKYARFLHSNRHKLRIFKELSFETFQKINAQRGTEIPDNFYPLTQAYCPECSTMIWHDNDPAGWIVFEANGKRALYVHQMYIKEKYRNKGLFIPLLSFAFQQMPKAVKRYFFYVNDDNTNMLGLLRLFGEYNIKRKVLIEMVKELNKGKER